MMERLLDVKVTRYGTILEEIELICTMMRQWRSGMKKSSRAQPARLVIADDHPLVRRGTRAIWRASRTSR
jgi:hypothetical protein